MTVGRTHFHSGLSTTTPAATITQISRSSRSGGATFRLSSSRCRTWAASRTRSQARQIGRQFQFDTGRRTVAGVVAQRELPTEIIDQGRHDRQPQAGGRAQLEVARQPAPSSITSRTSLRPWCTACTMTVPLLDCRPCSMAFWHSSVMTSDNEVAMSPGTGTETCPHAERTPDRQPRPRRPP